jgi:hypothetical protein
MPIPNYDGSPESEWISSCMSEIGTEYPQEQALAICYKQMEMSKMSKSYESRFLNNVSKYETQFESKYKGIDLTKLAEGETEDPCQSGYRQLGMKDMGGVSVPNCIPEEEHPDFK